MQMIYGLGSGQSMVYQKFAGLVFAFTVLLISATANVGHAEESPPPTFREVLAIISAERSSLTSYEYSFSYRNQQSRDSGGSVERVYDCLLSVDADTQKELFTYEQIQVNHIGDDVEDEKVYDSLVSLAKGAFFSSVEADCLGYNSRFHKYTETGSTKRFVRLPFDIRCGALLSAGDVIARTSLEQLLAGIISERVTDIDGRWVSPGIAEYVVHGVRLHIDTERGFWPVYSESGAANLIPRNPFKPYSIAKVTLTKFDGQWMPEVMSIESNGTEFGMAFKYRSIRSGETAKSITEAELLEKVGAEKVIERASRAKVADLAKLPSE